MEEPIEDEVVIFEREEKPLVEDSRSNEELRAARRGYRFRKRLHGRAVVARDLD